MAAPYDFRFSPGSQDEYYAALRLLIEDTWRLSGGRRVLLVAHSLGGLMTTYFLNQQSDEWKDVYIKALVSLNAPWDGAMVVAQLQAAGDDWGMDIIDRNVIRDQQRSYETGYFLLPHGNTWGPDDVIIQTPERNFTVSDYEEMFDILGHPEGKEMLKRVRPAWDSIHHPGVDFYCWHGYGIPTVSGVVYEAGEWPHGVPQTPMGDGDGSVTTESLTACSRFARDEHAKGVTDVRGFEGLGHLDLLHHSEVILKLVEVAQGEDPSDWPEGKK